MACCDARGLFRGLDLGSLFQEKGENLATHEDIDKLVEQVSAVTKTTKEIEAKISDEVWDRQRKWELKRDVLLDAMKKLGVLPERLVSLVWSDPDTPLETRVGENLKWQRAAGEFDAVIFPTEVVCGPELVQAMRKFSLFARGSADKAMNGKNPGVSQEEWSRELVAKFSSATAAARKELGIGTQN